MKQILSSLTLLLVVFVGFCQSVNSQPEGSDTYNLDFEILTDGLPAVWLRKSGDCTYAVDSLTQMSGKYAAVLEYHGDQSDFGSWSIVIPCHFEGKRITLSGYIKTEGVEGFAGLWMRLDPGVAFGNMQERNIKGATAWTQYELTFALQPGKTEHIVVGGLLSGKGKVWFDGLRLQIDGKDIALVEQRPRKIVAADKDTEFAEASQVTEAMLARLSERELTELGLIWGYLKYYHPAIQQGDYNWDAELFRLIPRLCSAAPREREPLLAGWIDSLGEYELTEYRPDSRNVKLLPDLAWITDSGFSKELTKRLLRLKDAKRGANGYYIDFVSGVSNPVFLHERNPEALYPDAGYRLLAVYRYWNMIQYFFPNRHLIGEDWAGVLKRSIPQAVHAGDEGAYVFAVLDIINSLNDTHANLYTHSAPLEQWRGTRQAAVKASFVEGKAVVTGYSNDSLGRRSPLRPGDMILSLGGTSTERIVKERLNRNPASNRPTKLRNIAQDLLRSNASRIPVLYLRGGAKMVGEVDTYPLAQAKTTFLFASEPDTCFRMLNDKVAYLHMGALKSTYLYNLVGTIRNAEGLVVDLRCYPGDFSSIYMLGAILFAEPTDFFKVSEGSALQPGLFTFREGNKVGNYNMSPYKGRVVVLVNEDTQSMAEFAAMALRAAPNTTVVGSTTAGADGNVSLIELPGALRTYISGIGIYYPDGRETQRIGIVPDLEVKPTVAGVAAGHDEVLERAVAHIASGR